MGGRHYERTHKQCLMRSLPSQARAHYIQQWRSHHPCVGYLQEVTRHTSVAHTHTQLFIFYFLFPVLFVCPVTRQYQRTWTLLFIMSNHDMLLKSSIHLSTPLPSSIPSSGHSYALYFYSYPMSTSPPTPPNSTPSAPPLLLCPTHLTPPTSSAPPHPTQARSPDIQERIRSILDSGSAQRAESTRSRCVCVCVWVQ